ncbi:30S ribosomal protein S18 [bacterium]|nr:MAG: 30S ribosomal protein S18 [bacterium]
MRVSKRGISKRRPRRKTSFPLVAIVKKKNKPQYNLTESLSSKTGFAEGEARFSRRSPSSELGSGKPIEKKRYQFAEGSEQKKSVKKSRATIDYKNVVLLRKLITGQGKILPRHITQLTAKQERYAAKAIKSARILGLLPFINKSRPV